MVDENCYLCNELFQTRDLDIFRVSTYDLFIVLTKMTDPG